MHDFDHGNKSCSLTDHGHSAAKNCSQENRRKCRCLQDQHGNDKEHGNEGKQPNMEMTGQSSHIFINGCRVICTHRITAPHDCKYHKGNDPGRNRIVAHGADMAVQCSFCHGRSQIRRIRKRRHFVTEQSPANDSAGNHSGRKAHAQANSHTGQPCRSSRSIRSPRCQGKNRTQHQRCRQENTGLDDLESKID